MLTTGMDSVRSGVTTELQYLSRKACEIRPPTFVLKFLTQVQYSLCSVFSEGEKAPFDCSASFPAKKGVHRISE